jgi:hypothetical protein
MPAAAHVFTLSMAYACMQNGVRALMLDTYDFKGDVWLCHSSGGKCNDFTAFVSTLARSE